MKVTKSLMLFTLSLLFVRVFSRNSQEIICFDVQSCGNGIVEGGYFNELCMQSCLDLEKAHCPGLESCGVGDITDGVIMCDQYKDTAGTAAAKNSVKNVAQAAQVYVKNFGSIMQELEVDLIVPALNEETVYTYVPTSGALAHQPVTLTITKKN